MEFYDVLDHVVALLQRRGRVTYNALKLQFHLNDEQLAVLKDELLYAHPQVVEDAGRGLRWTGDTATPQAHEDDAQRAVRTGLGIVEAMAPLNARLQAQVGARRAVPLQVRLGIHTGLVVVGQAGRGL